MSRLRTDYIVSLVNRVTGPARQITDALAGIRPAAEGVRTSFGQRLEGAVRRNNARLAEARGGLVDAAAGYYTLKNAIGAPVRAAMSFESAMADVRKVVDFETPEGFANMARDIRQLAKELPISADGLAQIAAAAGEAGFVERDIIKVTRAAAQMGVAFGISAEAAGDALPNLMNSMNLTLDQAQLLADGINHLSNNMASGAPEVLDFMTRVGADSSAFGFAGEQSAAFGSAMIAAGAEANVAATSFRNMGRALTRGASSTSRQRSAFDELGLSAERVAEGMQRDAVGTTLDVIDALSRVPKEAQAALMNDLFGSEARALTPLLTNTDLLRQSLGLVAQQSEYAGSVLSEYTVRAATFGNQVQLFRNRLNDVGIILGNALIPGLTKLMDAIIPVIDRFGQFAEAHPELVANITAVTAGLIGLKVAVASLKFVGLLGRGGLLSTLSIGLKSLGAASVVARAGLASIAVPAGLVKVLTGLAGAVAAIGAAKLAVIAAAVAAVASAGAWIYRNWEGISALLGGVADAFRNRFGPAIEFVQQVLEPFQPLIEGFAGSLSAIKSAASGLGSIISDAFSGMFEKTEFSEGDLTNLRTQGQRIGDMMISAIIGPFAFFGAEIAQAVGDMSSVLYDAGVQLMQGLWDGIKSMMPVIASGIGGFGFRLGQRVRNSITGGSSDQPEEGRAFGGPVKAGFGYEIGEMGRERFVPDRDGWIVSNRELQKSLAAQAAAISSGNAFGSSLASAAQSFGSKAGRSIGDVNINLGGITISGVSDMRAAADEIAGEIGRSLQETLGGTFADEAR